MMSEKDSYGLKIMSQKQFDQYCSLISDERDLVDTSKDGYNQVKESIYSTSIKGFLRNCTDKASCFEDPGFNKRLEGLFYQTYSEWNRHAGFISDAKKEDITKNLDETMKSATGADKQEKLREAFGAYNKLIDILPGNTEELKKEKDFLKNMIKDSKHFEFMKENNQANGNSASKDFNTGR